MTFNHLFWTSREVPDGCWLKGLQEVEDEWELDDGVPRFDGFLPIGLWG